MCQLQLSRLYDAWWGVCLWGLWGWGGCVRRRPATWHMAMHDAWPVGPLNGQWQWQEEEEEE